MKNVKTVDTIITIVKMKNVFFRISTPIGGNLLLFLLLLLLLLLLSYMGDDCRLLVGNMTKSIYFRLSI